MEASLRLLRAFLVVAEEEHVGRAARRLFISQPALSQDIRRLEREVGADLFVRGSRGMTLTPAGRDFAGAVRRALNTVDLAVTMARRTAAGDRPLVSLAYTPSLGNHLLPLLLPELERDCPEVAIEEREVDTGEAAAGVEAGLYDLALAHCPDPSPRLTARPLGDEPLVVTIAADHPIARRGGPVALRELAGLDLLLWPREVAPAYFDRILAVCGGGGLEAPVRPGPRRALTRSYVLAQEPAFALLPRGAAALQVPGVEFLPVRDLEATVSLVLLRRRDDARAEVGAVAAALDALAGPLLASAPARRRSSTDRPDG